MQDTNEKEEMLQTVAMTGSWFELKELEGILSQEEIQALAKEIDSKERKTYSKEVYDQHPKEVEEEIQTNINRTVFVVDKDEKGRYIFRTYWPEEFKGKEYINRIIDVEKIDREVLARKITAAMKKHLDFDKFYAERGYTGEKIREALVSGIQKYSEIGAERKETEKDSLLDSAVKATEGNVRAAGIRNVVTCVKEQVKKIIKKSQKENSKEVGDD